MRASQGYARPLSRPLTEASAMGAMPSGFRSILLSRARFRHLSDTVSVLFKLSRRLDCTSGQALRLLSYES